MELLKDISANLIADLVAFVAGSIFSFAYIKKTCF